MVYSKNDTIFLIWCSLICSFLNMLNKKIYNVLNYCYRHQQLSILSAFVHVICFLPERKLSQLKTIDPDGLNIREETY